MECDLVVVTNYVNHLEFSSDKAYRKYPWSEENDLKKLERLGYIDVVFLPHSESFAEELNCLPKPKICGRFEIIRRPELFEGRGLILNKLLVLIEPSQIYVGRNCIQLEHYICHLMLTQPIPVEVVGVPLCRRPDGLVCSTQVDLLTNEEVEISKRIFPSLLGIVEAYLEGELDAQLLIRKARYDLECPELIVDYFAIVESSTFEPIEMLDPSKGGVLIIGVVVKGKHKLMDNIILAPIDRSKFKIV